jgi:hypothetical protein
MGIRHSVESPQNPPQIGMITYVAGVRRYARGAVMEAGRGAGRGAGAGIRGARPDRRRAQWQRGEGDVWRRRSGLRGGNWCAERCRNRHGGAASRAGQGTGESATGAVPALRGVGIGTASAPAGARPGSARKRRRCAARGGGGGARPEPAAARLRRQRRRAVAATEAAVRRRRAAI